MKIKLRYYTSSKDVINDIEDGMGSEGSRAEAIKLFNALEEADLIEFNTEIGKYVCSYTGDQFFGYWEGI